MRDAMGAQPTQEETEPPTPFFTRWAWKRGAVAGFVAAFAMGLAMMLVDESVLRATIAGLYGASGNLLVGWVAHLSHGTLFGLLFAAVLSDPILYHVTESIRKAVSAGVGFGLVLAVAGAGIVMPMWLSAVGATEAPTIPYITGPLLIWHGIYGAVLGWLFVALGGEEATHTDEESD